MNHLVRKRHYLKLQWKGRPYTTEKKIKNIIEKKSEMPLAHKWKEIALSDEWENRNDELAEVLSPQDL